MAKYNDTQLPIHTAELKLALDNLPAYVYIKDDYSRYVYANKLTLNLLACNESEQLFKLIEVDKDNSTVSLLAFT